MMNIENLDGRRDASGGYKVDVSRGGHDGRVSSEWFSRPDDEKFLSLSELYASAKGRAERSRTRTVESAAIRVEAHRDDPERLAFVLPDADAPVAPTHWSFGQLASLVSAPAAYLRQLPAPLAGINLQYGLTNHRAEQVKVLEVEGACPGPRSGDGPNCAPSPAPITAASMTMNSSRPCSASLATASATPAGRCRACSTGRRASTTPWLM
ncbi:MAG: hypothetical protein NXH88_10750 [Hyphomonas sp.]|nr:hypothetical protein [Hyphomonas sp.]